MNKLNNILYSKISDTFLIQIKDTIDAISHWETKNNIISFEVLKGTLDDVFINVIGNYTN